MFLDNLSTAMLQLCDSYAISYEAAAERCGMSTRYFGNIVRRKSAPSVATLEKLCSGFGMTPNDLLLTAETGHAPAMGGRPRLR